MLTKKHFKEGRMAALQVTYQLLEHFLELPSGHKVVDVFQDHLEAWSTHSFYITVKGPSMPEKPEGVKMKRILLSVTADGGVDWRNVDFVDDL